MEIIVYALVVIFLLISLLGSFIPSLPGPILSYMALLLYHAFISSVTINHLIWLALLVLFVTFLDYYMQIYGVKKAGGGKFAIRCSLLGIILGLFLFPPLGILFGAFIGAFIGASFEKGERNNIKIAFGAVWGFVLGTLLKLLTSVYLIYFMFLK